MSKLEQAFEKAKQMSPEQQEFFADLILQSDIESDEIFVLTEAEAAEIERRLNTPQKMYTLEEAFKGL